MSLLESTKTLLDQSLKHFTLREIARRSDGEVDYEWLKKFWQDGMRKIPDPSVNRVQSLHDTLKKLSPN